ncbi:MAG: dihydropteroate synthase [Candidatus Omnitrophica bacterium]|nr:dihydropteroate synthase [Candidatus Omnitrophota bacterium]
MIPRILSFNSQSDLIRQLREIKVDEYGIKIMSPKAESFLVKISKIPSISANILKQEMLSLGGDAAISRDSITGRDKQTSCLLMGNFIQLSRLIDKLRLQPFKLDGIGRSLEKTISNYRKNTFLIKCRNFVLDTAKKTLIMGIINVTPDSFSGDGLLKQDKTAAGSYVKLDKAVLQMAGQMLKQGADIIDVGAESSRPGAKPVAEKEEIKRVSSSIKALVKEFRVPVSADTYKPNVARVALDSGASIVNDITGLRESRMRKIISEYKAGVVIMHMKGTPRTMQRNPRYKSLIDEVVSFLANSIDMAIKDGISPESIIIDPGIGFGKTVEHNLEILKNLKELKVLGRPVLLGVSRKSFIGKILNTEPGNRVFGTAAAVSMAIKDGANILRVHDVEEVSQVVKICNAIINN